MGSKENRERRRRMPAPRIAKAITSWPRLGPVGLVLGLAMVERESLIERKDGLFQGKFMGGNGSIANNLGRGVWP